MKLSADNDVKFLKIFFNLNLDVNINLFSSHLNFICSDVEMIILERYQSRRGLLNDKKKIISLIK